MVNYQCCGHLLEFGEKLPDDTEFCMECVHDGHDEPRKQQLELIARRQGR